MPQFTTIKRSADQSKRRSISENVSNTVTNTNGVCLISSDQMKAKSSTIRSSASSSNTTTIGPTGPLLRETKIAQNIHHQPIQLGDYECHYKAIGRIGAQLVKGILAKSQFAGRTYAHKCSPKCVRQIELDSSVFRNPFTAPLHYGFIRAAMEVEQVTHIVRQDIRPSNETGQLSAIAPTTAAAASTSSSSSSSHVSLAKTNNYAKANNTKAKNNTKCKIGLEAFANDAVEDVPEEWICEDDEDSLMKQPCNTLNGLHPKFPLRYAEVGTRRKLVMHNFYITPCGKMLLYLEHVRQWLLRTGVDLDIDHFTLADGLILRSFEVTPNWYYPDISNGRERIPISAINFVDQDRYDIAKFQYVTSRMFHPELNLDIDEVEKFCSGCDCEDDCYDQANCACQQLTFEANCYRSYGYTYKRMEFPLEMGLYECNKRCRCSSKCANRVTQNGVRCNLQLFKTAGKGWGIRPLHWIPKGTFICAYNGELITQDILSKDEDYLVEEQFLADMDFIECAQNYITNSSNVIHDYQDRQVLFMKLIPAGRGTADFCIDATRFTNIGRMFNHSCDPNMYVQNIFINTHDLRLSHIAYFTLTDIQPLEELTWDYCYSVESDEERTLFCCCGSGRCRHRLL